jgi:hypothetical protein
VFSAAEAELVIDPPASSEEALELGSGTKEAVCVVLAVPFVAVVAVNSPPSAVAKPCNVLWKRARAATG